MDAPEAQQLDFQLQPTKKKPDRRYRKGSKYDPLLDSFINGDEALVIVGIKGRDANYIRTQLNKRIIARELPIKTSTVNNQCYLEKIAPIVEKDATKKEEKPKKE